MTAVDHVWHRCRLATLSPEREGLGVVEDGLIAERGGVIVYAGPASDAPRLDAASRTDCDGRWITPGLIDCHTHLVYGGNRAEEFEQRLAGASYQEIARRGGGIVSTVRATRAASEDELVSGARRRLDALIGEGVTTIEIKSGYGLELATERRQLRAARRLAAENPVTVRTTFLGAHALPPECTGNSKAYISDVCDEMMPALAAEGLVDAVDAFCENIAFSPDETAQVFSRARELNLAGPAPRRPALEPARRGACGAVRRAVGGSPRICRRGRRRGDARGRHRRGGASRRLSIFSASRKRRRSD